MALEYANMWDFECESDTKCFIHWLPGDLFLDGLSIGLSKEGEESTGEIVGVAVGISQLVGYGV